MIQHECGSTHIKFKFNEQVNEITYKCGRCGFEAEPVKLLHGKLGELIVSDLPDSFIYLVFPEADDYSLVKWMVKEEQWNDPNVITPPIDGTRFLVSICGRIIILFYEECSDEYDRGYKLGAFRTDDATYPAQCGYSEAPIKEPQKYGFQGWMSLPEIIPWKRGDDDNLLVA